MASLITLAEYKAVNGISTTDTANDAKITAMIPYASAAVIGFTERDFGSPVTTEERSYTYDGSGYVDIDDTATVTQVTLSLPNVADTVLLADQWRAGPPRRDDASMYYWIELYAGFGLSAISPEMGFTRNWDVMAAEGRWIYGPPPTIKVNATWGWTTVPEDVKLATAWTLHDWQARPSGEGVTAESIEGFARSWGGRAAGEATAFLGVPNRARDLLARYAKLHV